MKGGVALLLAFAVLALASMGALLAGRTVLRDRAVEGEALLGTRAALAADGALAWFLAEGWRRVPSPLGGEEVLVPPREVFPEDPPLVTDGEVRIRRLGPSARWPGSEVWRLTVRGRVRTSVRKGRAFVQTREVYVTVEDRGPPVKRAWRIAR